MRYTTTNNPLSNWYRSAILRARRNNVPICKEWSTWRDFAKWCESQGYDENTRLHYSAFNPFSPEYLRCKRPRPGDYEYIAYDGRDPYELIITSASSLLELSENLKRMGYDYDCHYIATSLCRNETIRPIARRRYGLVFEKIDLSNYNEDDEPFEERN